MSDFESMHELVGAYALNAIDDSERAAFEAHLDECGQCREELASFADVLDALSDEGAEGIQAPAGLAERIGSQIALTPQVGSAEEPRTADLSIGGAPVSDGDTANLPRIKEEINDAPYAQAAHASADNVIPFERAVASDDSASVGERSHAGRRSRLPMLLASAAATLAVAAVGIGFLVNGGSPDANLAAVDAVVEAPDARTIDLGVGDAQITVSDEAGGFAATGNAPDLASGEEYQLWMVNADGSIDPGPTFEAGDFETAVIVDLTGVDAIAVSVEPAGGSEQPTTDPLVAVPL